MTGCLHSQRDTEQLFCSASPRLRRQRCGMKGTRYHCGHATGFGQSWAVGTQADVGAEPSWHATGFGTQSVTQLGPPGLLTASLGSASLGSQHAGAQHPSGCFPTQGCGNTPWKGVVEMQRGPQPAWMLSQPLITPVSTQAEITIRLIKPCAPGPQLTGCGGRSSPHAPPAPGVLQEAQCQPVSRLRRDKRWGSPRLIHAGNSSHLHNEK